MTTDPPAPPASLPNYLQEGLPKQDDETLRDVQDYVSALLDYRSQEVAEEDLPDDADPIDDDQDGKGTLVKELVTCGDESCSCMSGGSKHGPYLYRYYRGDGTVKSEYVGKP
jgi:hypothetical protein